MALEHQHVHSNIDTHQHNHHGHHHHHYDNFNEHHKHAPNCKHKHDNNCHHYGPNQHAPDCKHHSNHCNEGMDRYKSLTAKEHKRRIRRRLLRQWGRRGNHVLQNIIASIWVWSLSESSLRYYYDNRIYDKIALFHGLQILSLLFFFYSSLTEPGFLSSNAIPKQTNQILKKHDDEIETLLPAHNNTDTETNAIMKIDPNKDAPPSLCRNCKMLRPIRAKHCYMCDRCVPRFDHHCPLIEQCVGAKNYRQFYVYCWSQFVISGWAFIIAMDCLFYSDSTNRSHMGWFWRIGFFLWMLYQIFIAASLCLFHTYLICTQQTTYEFVKPRKLKERLMYEEQSASMLSVDMLGDLKPKDSKRKGIMPMGIEFMMTMCVKMGFCLCDYPFSDGLFRNWYGFITADCLERPQYFKVKPVILIQSEPPKDIQSSDVVIDINDHKTKDGDD